MSCCVKSSVLRRLAEQKGQKSMLIKGCGQLLACGFALIKAKCSCSQKTLQIYLSNSAHWLWVRPVGFVASRALTKKSQHFLQMYEVCIYARVCASVCLCACVHTCLWLCAGRPRGHLVPTAVFSPDSVGNMWHEATHLQVMVLSHWCCALHSPRASARYLGSSWACTEPFYNREKKKPHQLFPRYISSLQPNATSLQLFSFFPNYANEAFSYWLATAASRLRMHPVRLLHCKEEHCVVRAHLRELFHYDERQPTQLQIADELLSFSQGAAPVSGLHVGLTENVEQISQLIHVQQAAPLHN